MPSENMPRLRLLLDAIKQLSMARSLESIMAIVRRAARELTDAQGATFVLRQGEQCFYADEDAISPLWKGHRFPLHMCISGWAMLNRSTVVIEDIYQDARIPWDAYRPTFVKSLVMVPIRKLEPIGSIGCYWATQKQATAGEIDVIESLAEAVAIAMENLKLYEELDHKVKELSRMNKAKDEFLMNLSHELRTPLNAMLGWAQMLQQGFLEADEVKEAGSVILRNGRMQEKMIVELLDMGQIIQGSLRLKKVALDPVELVKDSVQSLMQEAQTKGISLDVELPGEPQGILFSDEGRIQQVLGNVLGNALKFTPRGGQVRISLTREGPAIRIDVEDDGPGIEAEHLPMIFNRFWQADGTITRAHGGLGLGLAIVRDLIHILGGRIEASSEGPGQGSRFTLWLPLDQIPGKTLDEHEGPSLLQQVLDQPVTREPLRISVTEENGAKL